MRVLGEGGRIRGFGGRICEIEYERESGLGVPVRLTVYTVHIFVGEDQTTSIHVSFIKGDQPLAI